MKKYKTHVYSQYKEIHCNHLFVIVGFKVMVYGLISDSNKVCEGSFDEGGVEVLIENGVLTSKTTRRRWEMPP